MYLKTEMKNISKIIVLLGVVLILMTGCASSGNRAEAEAPMLTITAGKTKIQAMRTTFSWQNGDTGVEADGLHPLDMAEDLPALEVPEDGVVKLIFEKEPDQVTILVWKDSAAGSDAYTDPDFRLPISGEYTAALPANDRYLYQVHATWKMQDGTGGNAYYGFASVPKE